jgi:hypothetical protein
MDNNIYKGSQDCILVGKMTGLNGFTNTNLLKLLLKMRAIAKSKLKNRKLFSRLYNIIAEE